MNVQCPICLYTPKWKSNQPHVKYKREGDSHHFTGCPTCGDFILTDRAKSASEDITEHVAASAEVRKRREENDEVPLQLNENDIKKFIKKL